MNLRMAVIGTGHLGKIHARLLESVERAELVAVAEVRAGCTRHPELDEVLFACFDAGMLACYDAALG